MKDAASHVGSRSRIVTLVLALVGATAFALAMQSPWWTAGEVSIGPFGARHCFSGECRETGLSWIGSSASDLWMRSGVATRAGGYIAMFALIIVAGALAARRIPKLMSKASLVAILTVSVAGGYFVAKFPSLGGASVSYGLALFAVGIATGIASAILTLRLGAVPN